MDGKWMLQHGCHNGTMMSRDVGNSVQYATEEEAM